jgi:hypothetical protein
LLRDEHTRTRCQPLHFFKRRAGEVNVQATKALKRPISVPLESADANAINPVRIVVVRTGMMIRRRRERCHDGYCSHKSRLKEFRISETWGEG